MALVIKGEAELRKRLEAITDKRAMLKRLQTDTTAEAKRYLGGRYGRKITKTGNLSRSIRPGYLSGSSAIVEASAGYAAYIERGTGIYGPSGRPIVPKRKKFLAWQTGGPSKLTLAGQSRVRNGQNIGGWAFAKSVKGRPATPFLLPGAKKAAEGQGLPTTIVKLWNDAA